MYTLRRGSAQGQWIVCTTVGDMVTARTVAQRWSARYPDDYIEVEGPQGVLPLYEPPVSSPGRAG